RATTDPAPEVGDRYDTHEQVGVEHDLQLPSQAAWRVHVGTWPAMRYPGFGASLRTAGPGVCQAWADVALGDRLLLDNLPRQHDQQADLLLEGYTEVLSFFDWRAEPVNGSPAGPYAAGVRNDDSRGKRDNGSSVTLAAIDE